MTYSQAELGWAAGCVDGEGCISIRREAVSRSGRPQYALYLAVGNTDPRMPRKLHAMFGGSLVHKNARQKQRPLFEWRVFATRAGKVLEVLRPYMVIKGEQADVAIAFAATIRRTGGHTAEVHAARAIMKERIAVLKYEEVS
jgi:hypothetical protein